MTKTGRDCAKLCSKITFFNSQETEKSYFCIPRERSWGKDEERKKSIVLKRKYRQVHFQKLILFVDKCFPKNFRIFKRIFSENENTTCRPSSPLRKHNKSWISFSHLLANECNYFESMGIHVTLYHPQDIVATQKLRFDALFPNALEFFCKFSEIEVISWIIFTKKRNLGSNSIMSNIQ